MATLERVTQLQQEGQSDPQIIQTLQQEGIAPNEINEALSQSKIKSAISSEQAAGAMPESPQLPGAMPTVPEQPGALPPQPGMQASMAQPGMQASMTPPSAMPPQQSIMPPTQDYTAYPEEAGGYEQPGAYGAEGAYGDEYYGEGGADIETINEISEQIVEEKTAKIKKQVSSFSRFQEEIQLETQRLNERVKKIEDTINELQMTIIGKIGEYGKDIQNISKEMQVTQNSFSKILNPLTDTIRKVESLKEKSEKKETKKTSKKKSKK